MKIGGSGERKCFRQRKEDMQSCTLGVEWLECGVCGGECEKSRIKGKSVCKSDYKMWALL